MNLTILVKNNFVYFEKYRQGNLYYSIINPLDNKVYMFPVPIEDVGLASLMKEDRALIFMRWIRRAIENKTIVPKY